MNVYEMEGFLHGKCMPRDILVNESTAEYLVRKLNEATALKAERDALVVESAALKDAIPRLKDIDYSNDSMDDVSLAEDIGFNTAVTQINNMVIETPATDSALAAIRTNYMAEGAEIVASKAQVIYQERHKSGDFESAGKYLTTIKFANNIASDIREAK